LEIGERFGTNKRVAQKFGSSKAVAEWKGIPDIKVATA
jgi:hypothetical protein